jgi:hypothetical protein
MAKDDISHLDFDIPSNSKDDLLDVSPKSAAIITSITNLEIMTAFCVVNDIHAIIMPNGIYGSVAFLEDIFDGKPEKAIKTLTKNVEGLEAVLGQYKMGRIETSLYQNGKFVESLIPTFVIGNFSEVAEDALLGAVNLFQLVRGKNAKVDTEEVMKNLPKNYIPRKYQPLKPQEIEINHVQLKVFDTHLMKPEDAQKVLKNFRR